MIHTLERLLERAILIIHSCCLKSRFDGHKIRARYFIRSEAEKAEKKAHISKTALV